MGKKGTGGWVRRVKKGNTTTTYNSVKGVTRSYSTGSKGFRVTYSLLPGGKTKKTTTMSSGGMTKRQTETWGGFKRAKKYRYRKGKPLSFSGLFFIIIFFFIFAAVFGK